MPKRFFVSHAAEDKPIALELKDLLEGETWVDLHEIGVGDILLEEISSGIEVATDFVLLWSESASKSRWVKFELHMAYIRMLEDNAVAIRVVCLDSTQVPLYLRPFLQARGKFVPSDIALALRRTMPPAKPRRKFFNRHVEIGKIEDALHANDIVAQFVCGMPGSGKRSLAREALGRLTQGVGTVQRITVKAGVAEPELNLLVSAALGQEAAPADYEIRHVVEHTREQLVSFVEAGGVWLFEDAEHWLNDDGGLGRICRQVLDALATASTPFSKLAVFTSRRKPRIGAEFTSVSSVFVSGLSQSYSIPLLRSHGAPGSDEELAEVAAALDGHPLALEMVASRMPVDAATLREQRNAIAGDLVDPSAISPHVWRLLETLSLVDGPIMGEDLASFLNLDEEAFQNAVSEGSEYALLTYDKSGILSLHPLLRDYFLRSFRKHPDHRKNTEELADILIGRFDQMDLRDPLYVQTLLSTVKVLGLAGRFDQARNLRHGLIGALYQTALELYQEKRYTEALQYIDEALTGSDDVDMEVLGLRVKTLAYLGRIDEAKRIADARILKNPTSQSVIRDRGRVAFIAQEWESAIGYFHRAIPHRRNPAQLWSDIAQARIRLGEWEKALAAAKTAIDHGGDTPWTLNLYSEALERLGDLDGAEKVMSQAVSREPNNHIYRHRLGRISQQMGKRKRAVEHFRRSADIDPNYFQAWLSLASTLADDGEITEAEKALGAGSKIPGAPPAVVNNVRAKILLLSNDLDGAQNAIEVALSGRRDVQNLSMSIRIWIARAEKGMVAKGQASAQVNALARELDSKGGLANVLEFSRDFPGYFEG